ncbi:MAG TPA: HD domain-containing phosphohydrolase [Burkholderiaceae bacterium]|nr:HD domain-containing phosphohydrolase [Burkholderiaceae bacterium]
MTDGGHDATVATLLLVDDEENITRSLKRTLRNRPYRVLSTHAAADALKILQNEHVDVVVSDSRMPDMDGPTLLAQIQGRWPDTMRILLTGYTDITATIKAINEGRIHRYISKPWDDADLCTAIEQVLDYKALKAEREQLLHLTHEQNLALQSANETLELRVQERTAELAQASESLRQAHDELQRSYVTATEVFSSLISQRLPQDRQTNNEVITLVRAFSKAHKLPREQADDLAMGAALYNIGKLAWPDPLLLVPYDRLHRDDRERYRNYPRDGERLLMALEPAQNAATLIRHHQERWDGDGFPDRLAGPSIPLGSRILKMAVDFVEMQRGMVLSRALSRDDVIASMPKYAGRLYDPLLCAEFIEVARRVGTDDTELDETVLALETLTVSPDMIIARDLHAANGMLLLKQGKVLTESLIDKLRAFEDNEGTKYTLFVRKPDPEQAS